MQHCRLCITRACNIVRVFFVGFVQGLLGFLPSHAVSRRAVPSEGLSFEEDEKAIGLCKSLFRFHLKGCKGVLRL